MLVELPAVFKSDLEGATPRTRQVMASVARKYLRWCRDLQQDYRSIATAQGYLTSLEESGAKPGYRKYCHGAIHKMFKAEGLSTELLRAPKVAAEDWSRPAIPPDVVKTMINASNKKLTRLEQAYLALATVYGFRADELGRIGPDCFDWERGVLQIQAAKKGMMRVHLVPDYLQDLLKEIKAPIGSGKVYETWYQVEHKLMGKHATRTGFHSIRRSLDALLTDQLSDSVVRRFFGWRNKESDMTQRYGYVSYVDYASVKGETRTSYSRAKEVDEQVFRVHPFMGAWKQVLKS